jgi:hypothetical protein
MIVSQNFKFETLCLHAGQHPGSITTPRGVPVHRTSSYVFKSTRYASDLFVLREPGNIYPRIMNPTQDVLEQRVAVLENGAAALAFASPLQYTMPPSTSVPPETKSPSPAIFMAVPTRCLTAFCRSSGLLLNLWIQETPAILAVGEISLILNNSSRSF